MQVTVEESLAAWTGSIKAAGEVSRLGEYMVSAHFSRIGRTRVQAELDTPEDVAHLEGFIRKKKSGRHSMRRRSASTRSVSPNSRPASILRSIVSLLMLRKHAASGIPPAIPRRTNSNPVRRWRLLHLAFGV